MLDFNTALWSIDTFFHIRLREKVTKKSFVQIGKAERRWGFPYLWNQFSFPVSQVTLDSPSHITNKNPNIFLRYFLRNRAFDRGKRNQKGREAAKPTSWGSLLRAMLGALYVIYCVQWWYTLGIIILIFTSLLDFVWSHWQSWQHTYFLGWQMLILIQGAWVQYKHIW